MVPQAGKPRSGHSQHTSRHAQHRARPRLTACARLAWRRCAALTTACSIRAPKERPLRRHWASATAKVRLILRTARNASTPVRR